MNKKPYNKELSAFMKAHNLGLGSMTEGERAQISATYKRRFGKLRNTWFWTLIYPVRMCYRAWLRFLAGLRERKPNAKFFVKRRAYQFSKAYIKSLFPSEERRKEQENTVFEKDITFSILAPLYNTPEQFLKDMIGSVQAQTYGKWELCLADGSDEEHDYVGKLCEKYAADDPRIKYKKLEKNLGISENTNECIRMATGQYIALFDHDDVLIPTALYHNMRAIEKTDADFLYTDEATFLDEDIYNIITYHFKPNYAIDNLRANNYICHFSVFKRSLLDQVGLFDHAYDGSQDHDMILRLTHAAKKVVHIPRLLYLWRAHKNSVSQDINSKTYAIDAGKRAVLASLERDGLSATVESSPAFATIYKFNYKIKGEPKISVIIPNKDSLQLLANCVDSVLTLSTYKNYEILIVENNSTTPEIEEYYKLIETVDNVRVLRYPDGFNYSKINNFAVKEATGDYLLFLNNDIEIITANWMEELLMYAQRDDVACCGAKLYYGNRAIQHCGVITGAGPDRIAIHSFAGESPDEVGYMGRLYYAQNVSAVTAAMMLVKKEKFEEVGGFDEQLAVAYNDVDLCLKLLKKGYLNVVNPFAEAYHYESISRGYEEKRGNQDRFRAEVAYMQDKWKKVLAKPDPYYNPNMSQDKPWKFGVDAE